jgi:hypothetical protein
MVDTMIGYARAQAALRAGAKMRVFDWDKAARILVSRKPHEASAGLASDLEYTEGTIWRDGKPVLGEGAYLASNWAEPVLVIDGEEINCEVDGDTSWDANTKWPESALAILKAGAP